MQGPRGGLTAGREGARARGGDDARAQRRATARRQSALRRRRAHTSRYAPPAGRSEWVNTLHTQHVARDVAHRVPQDRDLRAGRLVRRGQQQLFERLVFVEECCGSDTSVAVVSATQTWLRSTPATQQLN